MVDAPAARAHGVSTHAPGVCPMVACTAGVRRPLPPVTQSAGRTDVLVWAEVRWLL